VLRGHELSVNSVCFSPDGHSIVSGSGDSTMRLWVIDGTPGAVLQGHARFRQLFSRPPTSILQCFGCNLDGVQSLSKQNKALFEDADRVWMKKGSAERSDDNGDDDSN
jgi:WD40 repeat protein